MLSFALVAAVRVVTGQIAARQKRMISCVQVVAAAEEEEEEGGNGIKQFNLFQLLPCTNCTSPARAGAATNPRNLLVNCCTKCNSPLKTRPCIRANFCKTHGY